VNAAGYSSGRAVRQPHRRSCRSCSPAGGPSGSCNFCRGTDHLDVPSGRLCDPTGRHVDTVPEHWNWRLLIFRTVGRKPVNIHRFFYSSKLVSCVLNLPATLLATAMPQELQGFTAYLWQSGSTAGHLFV